MTRFGSDSYQMMPSLPPFFRSLQEKGIISSLEKHLLGFYIQLGEQDEEVLLAFWMVHHRLTQGHTCFDLKAFASTSWVVESLEEEVSIAFPAYLPWLAKIESSSLVSPKEKPFVLEEGRLYLQRYWNYEEGLFQRIQEIRKKTKQVVPSAPTLSLLHSFFPEEVGGETNWQRIAAALALVQPFLVISGGPGTGKTSTVYNILKLLAFDFLQKNKKEERGYRIALVAPTGKAATRLQESILKKKNQELVKDQSEAEKLVLSMIPSEVTTIHRLLGSIQDSPYFRFHAKNPLLLDCLVVDEASMVDLSLMYQLVSAVKPRTKILLLGDKDQLSSVEAGTVLADLCLGSANHFSSSLQEKLEKEWKSRLPKNQNDSNSDNMGDYVVALQKSYRFSENSGIHQCAQWVIQGKKETAFSALLENRWQDISWQAIDSKEKLHFHLQKIVLKHFLFLFEKQGMDLSFFEKLNQFILLCAHRKGDFGVERINSFIEGFLREQGWIHGQRGELYAGQPILILENDYGLELYNGDVGIVYPCDESGELRAYFRNQQGTLRKLMPSKLPPFETVFAMTIHKSQGSEYNEVLVVFPERSSPIATRELLYTAITRAQKKVSLWGTSFVFDEMVTQKVSRSSGLGIRLWNQPTVS